jgi:hypothetical protein
MSFETRGSVVEEIKLCLENDGELYRSTRHPYELNLLRKLSSKKGYCHSLAVQGWLNVVTQYLKIYGKEWGLIWHEILEPTERCQLAETLASEFIERVKGGEYDGIQLSVKREFKFQEEA